MPLHNNTLHFSVDLSIFCSIYILHLTPFQVLCLHSTDPCIFFLRGLPLVNSKFALTVLIHLGHRLSDFTVSASASFATRYPFKNFHIVFDSFVPIVSIVKPYKTVQEYLIVLNYYM